MKSILRFNSVYCLYTKRTYKLSNWFLKNCWKNKLKMVEVGEKKESVRKRGHRIACVDWLTVFSALQFHTSNLIEVTTKTIYCSFSFFGISIRYIGQLWKQRVYLYSSHFNPLFCSECFFPKFKFPKMWWWKVFFFAHFFYIMKIHIFILKTCRYISFTKKCHRFHI